MELSGVIVLALVTCVTCTPYGYGEKSGAVAKAEANAASGAFGGVLPVIPLSIPSGGGFTGSFSKSSSSSFASSSASSSSSSSSFSYGGTAANGLAGNSLPSSLHVTPTAQNGFGASGSIAQAAAGASAIAGSSALSHNAGGLPCAGNNCNNVGSTNIKCSSNNCELTGHQHNINENKNCLSGQCQPSSLPNNYEANIQTANSPSIQQQTDLDDFEVNIGGKSKSSNNLSHGHVGHTCGLDVDGQKDCSYGKCGTNTNAAPHNIPVTSTYHNVNPSKENCNSPGSGCGNFKPLAPSGHAASTNLQQPAIHLTVPNIEPACSTHDCNPGLTGTNINNEKPSSYNVPILGGNYNDDTQATVPLYDLPSSAPPKSAITPKIPSYSDRIYSSQLPSNPAGTHRCDGTNCDSLNNPAHQTPSNPSCNTPNCGVHPVSSGPSEQTGYTKPGTVPALTQTTSFGISGAGSNSNHNAFSGHSDGFLKPNYNNPTANAGLLNDVARPASLGIPKTNNFSPSQNTQGSTGGLETSGESIHESNKGIKPNSNVVPSSQNIPSYTSGFGGSQGSFDTHTGSHFQSKPTNENSSSGPSQNIPSYTSGFGGSQGSFDTNTGSHFQSKPANENPSSGLSQNIPSYTSGFGGSQGSFDTNTGSHFQSKPANENPSSGLSQNIPSYTSGSGGSQGSFDTNTGSHFQSKPANENPSSGPSQNIPSYIGGFGGSQGSFDTHTGSHFQSKPTNENPSFGPSTTPHVDGIAAGSGQGSFALPKPVTSLHSGQAEIHSGVGSLNKPHTVGGASVPGLHGSFGIKPESGVGSYQQKVPIYTGGFGGSPGSFDTGSKIGTYYASKQTQDKIPSDSHITLPSGDHTGSGVTKNSGSKLSYNHETQKPSGLIPVHTEPPSNGYVAGASNALQPGLVKPVDEKTKLPPYLGGFGGPSGILKPNEYNVSPNLPTSPIGHTPCVSGVCGSPIAHNIGTGKANIFSSGTSSVSSASAKTQKVAYSGSFGGPPGLFKPFDDSKPSKNEHDGHTEKIITGEHDKSSSGINSEYGNSHLVKNNEPSGEHKAPSDSVNTDNTGANSNAAVFASSNALSANQGLSSSGCNSGCSSNYDSGNGGSFSSSLGSSNTGAVGGHDSLVGSIASANSVAGAGAGSFGTGRSFASSSASAHASAGAAVKGGYGRR